MCMNLCDCGTFANMSNLPSSRVRWVRERICMPIRPYRTTMTAIGTAKNRHVESSHRGIRSGI